MYQTILVPVDITDVGKAGVMLETARKLGGANAEIVLTHIVDEIPSYIAAQVPGGYGGPATREAKETLSRLAGETGGNVEIDVRMGNPAQGILQVAEERGADTIVIASHRPGLEDYFLGSTAARVVRHAKCTVIVIR